MTTQYLGSKGPVEIASMPYRYLCSARDKLIRDGFGKERAAEIEAMDARITVLDAEYAAADEARLLAEMSVAIDKIDAEMNAADDAFVSRAEIVF